MHISLVKSEVFAAAGEAVNENQSNHEGFLRAIAEFRDSIQIVFDGDRGHLLGREHLLEIVVFHVVFRTFHDFVQDLCD